MKLRLTSYQSVVRVDDIPAPQQADILQLLLDYLKLEIVREATPDYVGYELRDTSLTSTQRETSDA